MNTHNHSMIYRVQLEKSSKRAKLAKESLEKEEKARLKR
jgi:hypothetical protein